LSNKNKSASQNLKTFLNPNKALVSKKNQHLFFSPNHPAKQATHSAHELKSPIQPDSKALFSSQKILQRENFATQVTDSTAFST